jgi:hypothetical protein
MDGPARDPRLRLLPCRFAPTRLSEDTLTRVYDRVFQVPLRVQEAAQEGAADVAAGASSVLVVTGGQHG